MTLPFQGTEVLLDNVAPPAGKILISDSGYFYAPVYVYYLEL